MAYRMYTTYQVQELKRAHARHLMTARLAFFVFGFAVAFFFFNYL